MEQCKIMFTEDELYELYKSDPQKYEFFKDNTNDKFVSYFSSKKC